MEKRFCIELGTRTQRKRTKPSRLCPLSSASHDAVILVGESSQAWVVGSPPEKMHAHQRSQAISLHFNNCARIYEFLIF
jgi:hypothetical protein